MKLDPYLPPNKIPPYSNKIFSVKPETLKQLQKKKK